MVPYGEEERKQNAEFNKPMETLTKLAKSNPDAIESTIAALQKRKQEQ